jgi:hypothetical protein
MTQLHKVIFGDNQFFGINHMSQEKAQQLAERFNELSSVFAAYRTAYSLGIRGYMLNSNDKAGEICDYFREHRKDFADMAIYPSIPYPHKYANLVADRGIVGTLQEVLSGQGAAGLLGLAGKGLSLLTGDLTRILTMLVDIEMKIYRGLDVRVIYLQNIVTDLLLGLGFRDVLAEYCRYIEKKFQATPGFLTMNLPQLAKYLRECGIENAAICSSINKRGYLMSPDIASYEAYLRGPQTYPVTAMSVFASGAIPAPEAIQYIREQGIRSVVFGASSRQHMEATLELMREIE